MKSRKPEAKKFRKWVTSEVLPSLRKTGSYSAPSEPTTQPQFSTMGERVKYLWQRSEFHTIAELERKADISRDVIRRLIGGHSITLSSMNLVRVAKALGVRPEVLTGTEPMPELPERGANNPSVFGLGLGWFLQMSSHVDIAKMEEGLNLPHGMVGDILSGHIQTPDLKTALKIAQYLNISPYVLAGMEYPKAPYRDGADELERMKVHIRNLQHIVANRLHVPLTSLTDCGLYGHNMADYHNHVILPHRIQNPDSGEEYPPF